MSPRPLLVRSGHDFAAAAEGVWQGVVEEIVDRLRGYAGHGALLLIEQHVAFALELADECADLQRGEVVLSGPAEQMKDSRELAAHLGP